MGRECKLVQLEGKGVGEGSGEIQELDHAKASHSK